MNKKVIKIIGLILMLIILDQGIKIYMNINKPMLELIHGFLCFNYVENTGSAFGLGSGNTITIIVSNFIVLGIVIKFMVNQFERIDTLTRTMLCMVLAGGVSNLLDRIIRGFVVDYIAVANFPVFNLADVYIVLGWIILVFLTIKYTFKMQKENCKKGAKV